MNERLRRVRQCLGLTMEDFGKKIGVSRSTISNLENGNRSPSNHLIKFICREYNVDEHWLRTGEGDMYNPELDDVASVVYELLDDHNPTFDLVVELVRAYSKLDSKSKKVIDDLIDDSIKACAEKEG